MINESESGATRAQRTPDPGPGFRFSRDRAESKSKFACGCGWYSNLNLAIYIMYLALPPYDAPLFHYQIPDFRTQIANCTDKYRHKQEGEWPS